MPLISLSSSRRYPYPPPPFRRATEISKGRGDLRGGNIRGGGVLLTELFFPGGLSKIGDLLINKSFSVE